MLLKMFIQRYNKYVDPARNLKKKWKEQVYLHVMFNYYSACLKDERKLQYSRSNILGFINAGYFTIQRN
jgi:hypothetical protein